MKTSSYQFLEVNIFTQLLHAPMFTLTVNMSLQMFYSNIMAHMPSAYGLGKNTIFNKVQFSSVQFSLHVYEPCHEISNNAVCATSK